jgi:uncharacterized membrane protein
MGWFGKTFLKGLVTIFPLLVTVVAIIWLVTTAEQVLGAPIQAVLPEGYYVLGMGVVVGAVLIFAVGLMLNIVIARALFHRFELLLNRLPLVKSLYGSVKDLMGYFMDSNQKGQQVVMVTLGGPFLPPGADGQGAHGTPMKLLGLVTRQDFSDLPAGVGDDQCVAVYLPMSYQLGGFTVMVRRSQVEPIEMSTEDALRFAITAGMNAKAKPAALEEDIAEVQAELPAGAKTL